VEVAQVLAARLLDQANELLLFSPIEEDAMATLARPGVPVGGFKTVGQIHATNDLVFQRNQNAMGVAVELLSTHTPGAPVVDERGEFVGFVSEFDILRALEAKKDLNRLTAGDVMAKDRISVTEDTSIDEAVKIMEEKRLLNLPVKVNGTVVYSITRHDLLRAWIGLGVDIESNIAP
jgi:CBS domain-containing protein